MSAEPTKRPRNKEAAMPIEVVILTQDHEIQGIVHVSRDAREDRRISELLNDKERRFLAVTDAQLVSRNTPSSPRRYRFLQLHIDNILMIHPSTQAVASNSDYTREEGLRFDALRAKFNNGRQAEAS